MNFLGLSRSTIIGRENKGHNVAQLLVVVVGGEDCVRVRFKIVLFREGFVCVQLEISTSYRSRSRSEFIPNIIEVNTKKEKLRFELEYLSGFTRKCRSGTSRGVSVFSVYIPQSEGRALLSCAQLH